MSELNAFQKWCKDNLHVVQAAANGEEIEYESYAGKWIDRGDSMAVIFKQGLKYRIKPRTIKVNGFNVPEPMKQAPDIGTDYFVSSVVQEHYHIPSCWDGYSEDYLRLSRNICHTTKEAAIAHAKAMLGIDLSKNENESN